MGLILALGFGGEGRSVRKIYGDAQRNDRPEDDSGNDRSSAGRISVYKFYGVSPYWTDSSRPDIVSYRMSGRTDNLAFNFWDGSLITSSGAAPYWTTCGSCGGEAMNFKGMAEPALPSDATAGQCYALTFVAPRC